jgi:hypothetical protein
MLALTGAEWKGESQIDGQPHSANYFIVSLCDCALNAASSSLVAYAKSWEIPLDIDPLLLFANLSQHVRP